MNGLLEFQPRNPIFRPVKTSKKRKSAEKLDNPSSSNKRKAKPGTEEITAGNQDNSEIPEGRLACPFKTVIRAIGTLVLQNFEIQEDAIGYLAIGLQILVNLFKENISSIFGIKPVINVVDVVIVLHYCLQG
ncbi:hypothetical protein AVEN_222474-1 [Araneus ventricosus]|uniref:Uncharacterized protein n=1 Tax=Araneus ventricosus TaxID=182803 RepID=A0A4Y2RKJ8_ARAVE|nr:hypothetical protein AVEN_40037-1 [Araneus ventricosus]GBN76228.1 hypothetical protein AVEN_222474-1 [Araneus ventricosus]